MTKEMELRAHVMGFKSAASSPSSLCTFSILFSSLKRSSTSFGDDRARIKARLLRQRYGTP